MSDSIVWIVLFPLLGAVICTLFGTFSKKLCYPVSVLSMALSVWASVKTLIQAMHSSDHQVSYILGGWSLDLFPRGVGIEFRADLLGALIALVVSGVGFIVSLYSKIPVQRQTPGKEPMYYGLFLLQIVGLAGITITRQCSHFDKYIQIKSISSKGNASKTDNL